jgi:hypothetical protein
MQWQQPMQPVLQAASAEQHLLLLQAALRGRRRSCQQHKVLGMAVMQQRRLQVHSSST